MNSGVIHVGSSITSVWSCIVVGRKKRPCEEKDDFEVPNDGGSLMPPLPLESMLETNSPYAYSAGCSLFIGSYEYVCPDGNCFYRSVSVNPRDWKQTKPKALKYFPGISRLTRILSRPLYLPLEPDHGWWTCGTQAACKRDLEPS